MSRIITPSSPEWSEGLTEAVAIGPPKRLFVSGRELPDWKKCIAVVGTRRPTGAGRDAAREIATRLAQANFIVVSGLALGIDSVAHQAALDANGHTIAVLGCGLDREYPKQNAALKARIEATGTLVTEYPAGQDPRAFHFPERNRIIAALCRAVVVVEGAGRSGALITARYALDANRGVYAVPGSIRNPAAVGPNELIRTGNASLITSADDLFEDIAPGLVWEDSDGPLGRAPTLDAVEQAVLLQMDDGPNPMGRVSADVEAPPGKVALTMSRLEVRGLIAKRITGYELTDAGVRARASLSYA
ncbi:MAG: DNA-processing protein DprA [Actinobacteria bacterium]|nr:DNA-processing protein DprA [Actinomycetota bacterium]